MKTLKPAPTTDKKSALEKLAIRVQELYLVAQTASPKDRARANSLYQEAYHAYRKQKLFTLEQEALLLP